MGLESRQKTFSRVLQNRDWSAENQKGHSVEIPDVKKPSPFFQKWQNHRPVISEQTRKFWRFKTR